MHILNSASRFQSCSYKMLWKEDPLSLSQNCAWLDDDDDITVICTIFAGSKLSKTNTPSSDNLSNNNNEDSKRYIWLSMCYIGPITLMLCFRHSWNIRSFGGDAASPLLHFCLSLIVQIQEYTTPRAVKNLKKEKKKKAYSLIWHLLMFN